VIATIHFTCCCVCKNARQIPVLSKEEKKAQAAVLRLNFPVSSGMQHRAREAGWEPVTTASAVPMTATVSEAKPEQEVCLHL